MPTRAAIYLRVSSRRQADGYSLDTQLEGRRAHDPAPVARGGAGAVGRLEGGGGGQAGAAFLEGAPYGARRLALEALGVVVTVLSPRSKPRWRLDLDDSVRFDLPNWTESGLAQGPALEEGRVLAGAPLDQLVKLRAVHPANVREPGGDAAARGLLRGHEGQVVEVAVVADVNVDLTLPPQLPDVRDNSHGLLHGGCHSGLQKDLSATRAVNFYAMYIL